MTDEVKFEQAFYDSQKQLQTQLYKMAEAATKFAIAADKAVDLIGAAVSQLDEIRKEVTTLASCVMPNEVKP